MGEANILLIALAVFIMAGLYSTVGHGGGSGYVAVFALVGVLPEQMRATALILNIVVASIATLKFSATGTFRKNLFVLLVCASIPAAFLGGYIDVTSSIYKPIVGIFLLYAAVRLFVPLSGHEKNSTPNKPLIVLAGVVIGFLSGIIGIGGGIFLSPLVLLLGWATAKQTAAISAPFILVNSVAGLGGILLDSNGAPIHFGQVYPLIIAVLIGGVVGSTIGSKKIGHQGLRTILGIVLLIASLKMFFTTNASTNQQLPNPVKSTG